MREFAKSFYASKAWRNVREYVYRRDMGLCVRCGKPGEIVHHIEHLTPRNIDDPNVALAENNLELLCRNCHAVEHEGEAATAEELEFDENGDIVLRRCSDDRYM